MILRRLALFSLLITLNSYADGEQSSAPGPLDAAGILLESGGSLNSELIGELFGTAFAANMQVEPEHLGIAFYDKRNGKPLDRREIRELMGAIRQDGAYEILELVAPLLAPLGVDTQQLQSLLDAAFIASMRRPPGHIDIEFYDRRHGPSGRGGGISGSTPDPSRPRTRTEPEALPGRPAHLPADEQALVAKLNSLGLQAPAREGKLIFPLMVWGHKEDDFQALTEAYLEEARQLGLEFHGLASDPHEDHRDNWVVIYALGYFSTTDAELASEINELMRDIQ